MHWFKPSYSRGDNNCVEVARLPDQPWHKAIYSGSHGECVEVSEDPITGVRDTKYLSVRSSSALTNGRLFWIAPASTFERRTYA